MAKKLLLVGIDPRLIDFNSSEFAAFPGLTAEKVEMGIKGSILQLEEMGYQTELCWTDFGNTAIEVLEKHLSSNAFDGVLIGAGIRVPEKNFILFEKMMNTVHSHAPAAKMIFNTKPQDTIESVKRWVS